ncbi:lipoate--protein ligase [Companilactobacillus sp.]|uniref:lipoate--protein ligase n=1 Tax=Companilactobacillus sp. TaxID=2767905 RepID=UPI0025C13785|nr:lipoate--protein ligase [Companilactobacillus sp.]MCH4008254.1 lipoate--protein ligase [Companilactobacillus sp.]MCH4051567.1 lipoate--protein ligase [Companilactobacillus sp.]MCH4076197.1 lipoate--protein ligase [Companilactobacillus sp.]MCH4124772.1 lipoate--protein ligase [Companilactobacillus sp.]MCH4131314.1 lipoate--protein ligase [Companilactobacillus sp.]
MYYVLMKDRDIRDNLATEQYLMNNVEFDEPLVLFYIEKPCIIVGHNQNTLEEINSDYVKDHNITVTRRISGGGAVYQDLGNLCFSFVVDSDDKNFGDFKSFTQPIVDALHDMGATTAEVSGRNDLLVDGKKFSGNAMYSKNGKTFSHGTLSLDVDLSVLTEALNVPADKIASKGIKSIRSRVTNLKPYLDEKYQNLTTEQFRDRLLLELFHADNIEDIKDKEYVVTDEDQKAIDKIKEDYYYNWDWVYGKSPKFTAKQRKHFDMGTVDVRYNVEDGKIENAEIYGDYFGMKDANDIKKALLGVKFDRDEILSVLAKFNLDDYFKGIPQDELSKLFTP